MSTTSSACLMFVQFTPSVQGVRHKKLLEDENHIKTNLRRVFLIHMTINFTEPNYLHKIETFNSADVLYPNPLNKPHLYFPISPLAVLFITN